jgi:hypothetical protein
MTNPRCRICGSPDLELAWELAPSPYGDLFRETKEAAQNLPLIGLTLVICRECKLLQITQEVDVEKIYEDYLHQSSVTSGLTDYYRRLSRKLVSQIGLQENDLVIDVGSNDGTGLIPYRDRNFRILGIEPSRAPTAAALSVGIPTINSFLDESTVASALSKHGPAKLVYSNYLAANVPDPVAFFQNMRAMLTPDGAITVVTGYHPDQFALNMFDYINHDHLSYFSVGSAVRLAEACNLKLTGADRVEHKGGSIHLVFHLADAAVEPDESISKLMQRERWMNVNDVAAYGALASRIESAGVEARELLSSLGAVEVAGVGASISTTHLLHQFKLGTTVQKLYDDDQNKVGRFSPGYGIEVARLSDLPEWSPTAAVILAWQHTDVLITRLRECGFVGPVISPLPRTSSFSLP